jgi:hypothetical protein
MLTILPPKRRFDALSILWFYKATLDSGASVAMDEIRIRVLRHRLTGLVMAISDDLPGFVVHAHSHDELAEKIQGAYEGFMRAIGRGDEVAVVVPEDAPPGYECCAFIAKVERRKAA